MHVDGQHACQHTKLLHTALENGSWFRLQVLLASLASLIYTVHYTKLLKLSKATSGE